MYQQTNADTNAVCLRAHDAALTAYNVIAYRIGVEASDEHNNLLETLSSVAATNDDMVAAMTVSSNMMDIAGYYLTPHGILSLARLYAALREVCGDDIDCYSLVDPFTDVCRAKGITINDEVKRFNCMYPGFPKQVMEMDEAKYRFDQLLHYASTYGVEMFINSTLELLGDNQRIYVSEGWLPHRDTNGDVGDEASERPDDERGAQITAELSYGKMLDVFLTEEELRSKAFDSFITPARLTRDVLIVVRDVATAAPSNVCLPRAGFRENALNLAALALDGCGGRDFKRIARETISTVDDAMKLIALVASGGEFNGTGKCETSMRTRLTTSQKRSICRQLERFSADDIRRFGVDQKLPVRRALTKLSPSQHIRNIDQLTAVKDVIEGNIPSFDAHINMELSSIDSALEIGDRGVALDALRDLLAILSERPGIMLRKATVVLDRADRIDSLRADQDTDDFFGTIGDKPNTEAVDAMLAAYLDAAPKMSLVSLVQAATIMSSDTAPRFVRNTQACSPFSRWGNRMAGSSVMPSMKFIPELADGDDGEHYGEYMENIGGNPFANVARRHLCAERIVVPCLRERIASTGGAAELAGKRVRVDWGTIDPNVSMLVPNEAGKSSTGMPMPGAALPLPADAVVRFFVFWDDRGKRVDVDLHAASYVDRRWDRIGWDASYNAGGVTMSGDITTSVDSAEYIDVDFVKARKAGIQSIRTLVHLFSGCDAFSGVDTIRVGALVVGDADAALYSPDRCIFTDDLTTVDARKIQYAEIGGIQEGTPWIRVLKGAELPYETSYTMRRYVEDLVECSGATVVAGDDDEADVIVRVERGGNDGDISLLDNGFYFGL